MKLQERYDNIINWFRREMPTADTELEFGSVFQLLVAVVLSAQCTDKRVNIVTRELFKAFPDAYALGNADIYEVYEYIRSVSYPNAKAKHIVEMARKIVSDYDGEVPADMDKLLTLPGIGRKTANVIQAVAFGKSTMAVDTHVFRVSHRIGLVTKSATTPLKVEQQLVKHICSEDIPRAHHWLLLHGRYVCTARSPHCDKCGISQWCAKRI